MFDWENAIALHAMQGNRASSRGVDNQHEYEIWINDEYFDTIKDSAYSTNIDFISSPTLL